MYIFTRCLILNHQYISTTSPSSRPWGENSTDDREIPQEAQPALHGKIAAPVLLKLFITGNEKCHTTDAPSTLADFHSQMYTAYNQWSQRIRKNVSTQWWSTGRHFTAATQALNTSCSKYQFFQNTKTCSGPAPIYELVYTPEARVEYTAGRLIRIL